MTAFITGSIHAELSPHMEYKRKTSQSKCKVCRDKFHWALAVISIHFLVPSTAIMTSISTVGPPVAGYNFTLTCTVTQTEGLIRRPSLMWIDSNSQLVTSTGDIMINTVNSGQMINYTLQFDPIRTSDEGSYTCIAILASPALTMTINSSATYVIDVQQSKFQHS